MDKFKEYKYIILVSIFIIITFGIVLFNFSNSYALEGYGVTNLSCDKTKAYVGDEINCVITGNVSEGNNVSSLSSQITLSDSLELISVTIDNVWQGTGDDGNLQLYYRDNYLTNNFAIGSFKVKVKENVFNTTENIELKDTYFYGGDNLSWKEEAIEDSKVEVNTPQFNSSKYDFTKDYIIVDTKDVNKIISNINTEDCNIVVNNSNKDVTTGNIIDGSKLKVTYKDNLLKEYNIVYMGSSKYSLNDEYIISSLGNINEIVNDFETFNSNLIIKNGKLVLIHNSTDIKSYDIINLSSTKYKIDLINNYIIADNTDILNDINKTNNVTLDVTNGNLNITYDNNIIKSLKIYTISSEKYDINIPNGYIYVGKKTNDLVNNINSNATITLDGNKIKLNSGDTALFSLDIIGIDSSKYTINYDSNYIYTKTNISISEFNSNTNLINAKASINNNVLSLKYGDILVKEFALYYITSENYKIDSTTIYTREEVNYNTFVNGINFNSLTYKIRNASGNEINSGNVSDNYSIKLYKDDTLLDTYLIILEYLEINDLTKNDDDKIIYKLKLGTTYSELLKNIDTSGKITIKNSSGKEVSVDSVIKTSDIISIKLSSKVVEYKISVLGDVASDGAINIGDIAKLYSYLKKKIQIDKESELSGDVVLDGNINIGDVAKLYSYLKKKIPNLN